MSYYKYVYVPIGDNRYKRYTRKDWVNIPLRDKVRGNIFTEIDLGDIHTGKVKESS